MPVPNYLWELETELVLEDVERNTQYNEALID